MAKWTQRYKTPTDGQQAFQEAISPFQKDYPEVASLLGGTWTKEGGIDIPPYGVRLFINGGALKFQISRKDERLMGFGVISDPHNILLSLESAISQDEIGWKQGTEQTIPY